MGCKAERIRYQLSAPMAMKAQVLSDFLAECTWRFEDEVLSAEEGIPKDTESVWMLHIDRASNATRCGVGLILAEPDGHTVEYALRFSFHASNNQAEYEALLARLRIAKSLGVQRLRDFSDSQLVVNQVKREYEARDPTMVQYLEKVQILSSPLEHFEIIHISRSENSRADALSRLATTTPESLGHTYIEHLETLSIAEEDMEVHQIDAKPSWMDPIFKYLNEGALPEDKAKAKKVR